MSEFETITRFMGFDERGRIGRREVTNMPSSFRTRPGVALHALALLLLALIVRLSAACNNSGGQGSDIADAEAEAAAVVDADAGWDASQPLPDTGPGEDAGDGDAGLEQDGGCHELIIAAGLSCDAEPVRVSWVAAHPDDEALVAPLLGELCHVAQVRCEMLVATRGEGSASCYIDGGCNPDLGTIRAEEMRRSAALLNAQLTQWSLPNGGPRPGTPEGVIAYWSQLRGGQAILVSEIAAEIQRMDPDLLLSFDPRHGDTCHEEHRALGALVLDALDSLAIKPGAFFFPVGTKDQSATWVGFRPVCADPAVVVYDATRVVPETQQQAWQYLIEVMLAHQSQFELGYVGMAARAPPEARVVPLLPRSEYGADVPCYSTFCARRVLDGSGGCLGRRAAFRNNRPRRQATRDRTTQHHDPDGPGQLVFPEKVAGRFHLSPGSESRAELRIQIGFKRPCPGHCHGYRTPAEDDSPRPGGG